MEQFAVDVKSKNVFCGNRKIGGNVNVSQLREGQAIMQVYKIINLLWILLVIFSIIYLNQFSLPCQEVICEVCEAVSCLKTDWVSFTELSEKLLHRQSDSHSDEVIESLFKEILTLDGAAKLQDSQVCKTKLS